AHQIPYVDNGLRYSRALQPVRRVFRPCDQPLTPNRMAQPAATSSARLFMPCHRPNAARWLTLACLLLAPAAVRSDGGSEFFEKKIRPLLVEDCQGCHGEKKQKGGLRLDSRPALEAGGDSGPVVVSGRPDVSRLVEAVRYTGDLRMPPRGKLTDEQIADLTAWVKSGAPWPAGPAAVQGAK